MLDKSIWSLAAKGQRPCYINNPFHLRVWTIQEVYYECSHSNCCQAFDPLFRPIRNAFKRIIRARDVPLEHTRAALGPADNRRDPVFAGNYVYGIRVCEFSRRKPIRRLRRTILIETTRFGCCVATLWNVHNNRTIECGRLILVAELLSVDRRLLRKNFTISKSGKFRRLFIKNHRGPSALSLSYFIP